MQQTDLNKKMNCKYKERTETKMGLGAKITKKEKTIKYQIGHLFVNPLSVSFV